MSDFYIREYREEDIPELKRLWMAVFEDSEELLCDFFRLLPEMGSGLVVEMDRKIFGAAYIITGFHLSDSGKKCAYLYAVAVDETMRGHGAGRALSCAAVKKGVELGADIICTLPAEDSLYPWYREIIGVDCAIYRKSTELESEPVLPVCEISIEDYAQRREEILGEKPHVILSEAALEFQQRLCRAYAGGFFAVGSGIAAAYTSENLCYVRELLCAEESERNNAAASVGAFLGREDTMLFEPAAGGSKYIAAGPDTIPEDCIWNLSFD